MSRNGHGSRPLKLGRLLAASPAARLRDGSAAAEIAGLAYDSRAVRPGFLFCALPGEKTDGGLYAELIQNRSFKNTRGPRGRAAELEGATPDAIAQASTNAGYPARLVAPAS